MESVKSTRIVDKDATETHHATRSTATHTSSSAHHASEVHAASARRAAHAAHTRRPAGTTLELAVIRDRDAVLLVLVNPLRGEASPRSASKAGRISRGQLVPHLRKVGLQPLKPNLLLREPGPELLLSLLLLEDQLEVPARKVLLGRGRVDRGEQVELELVGVLRDALVGAAGEQRAAN